MGRRERCRREALQLGPSKGAIARISSYGASAAPHKASLVTSIQKQAQTTRFSRRPLVLAGPGGGDQTLPGTPPQRQCASKILLYCSSHLHRSSLLRHHRPRPLASSVPSVCLIVASRTTFH